MSRRILVLGPTAASLRFTENCADGLRQAGAHAEIAPLMDYTRYFAFLPRYLRAVKRRLNPNYIELFDEDAACVDNLFRQVETGYDAVLLTAGHHLRAATLFRLGEVCRRKGSALLVWFIDDPFMQWIQPPVARREILEARTVFDRTYVFDSYYCEKLASFGFRNPTTLPLAADPVVFAEPSIPEDALASRRCDLSFAGTWNERREAVLASLTDFDLKLYGSRDWRDPALHRATVSDWHVSHEELMTIFRASKVNLNINHPQSIHGSNLRSYEIAMAGGVCVTERKIDLLEQFEDGKEIVYYDAPDELPGILRTLLADDGKRKVIGEAARARAVGEHTFAHRMRRMLEVL